MTPASVTAWRDGGRFLSTNAGSIFVRSNAGVGPTILLLHGYPSSSFDYRGVEDPVATTEVLDALRLLRPRAEVIELPGVGH